VVLPCVARVVYISCVEDTVFSGHGPAYHQKGGCGLWTAWACVTGGCTGRNDCDGCNGSGDNIDSGSGEGFEVKWYDVCNG
jgi:hypothetical protein